MHVFVTGATGMVGTHLVRRLLEKDYRISALVRKSSDTTLLRQCGTVDIVRGDLLNLTEDVLPENIDIFVHCAAVTAFPKNAEKSFPGYRINVEGTRSAVESAFRMGAQRFIYISSCSAMGDSSADVRDETFSTGPDTAYGRSKLEAERVVQDYCVGKQLEYTIIRPALIYGPQDKTGLINMVARIDNGRFFIFGNGENRKSPVFVKNLVEAICLCIEREKAGNQIFLVNDGSSYSLNELSGEIANQLGKKAAFMHIPASICLLAGKLMDFIALLTGASMPVGYGQVKKIMSNNVYDIRKIENLLNYRPTFTLQQGIRETVKWYLSTKHST